MAKFMAVVKKKPVLIGVVGIGAVVVIYLMMKGGGSESGGSMGYGDMQVASASQLNAMQGQYAMQGQQIQGQLAMAQIAASSQLAVAQENNATQEALAALALESVRVQQATQLAGISSQERIETLGLQKSAEIQSLQISSQLEAMKTQAQKDYMTSKLMADAQINMATLSSQVTMAGIAAQEAIGHHTLDATTQQIKYQSELVQNLGAQQVDIARINADTQKYMAKKSGQSSMFGSLMGLAGTAMMMFSDIKIKTIHGCVSTEKCLAAIENSPIDFWRYLECEEMHMGTYSQDFYRELGAPDWATRDRIHVVDMFGAMNGALKEMSRRMAALEKREAA